MGRRALRGIDPALDLTPYYRQLDELPDDWKLGDWFQRDAPIEVEIGSGKGLFLTNASRQEPEHDFLGIEISRKSARFTAARLAKAERLNVGILQRDAQQLVAAHIPSTSVAAVHVYFPDPWWKKRHRRRRVMNESFMRHLERILQPNGRLHFWTDVEEYFQESMALLAQVTNLQGPLEVPVQPATHDLDYRTHFERRMRLHGEAVFRSEFVRAT